MDESGVEESVDLWGVSCGHGCMAAAVTGPSTVFASLSIRWWWFFFSSRRRHTRWTGDWSSDVCSSDLVERCITRVGARQGAVAAASPREAAAGMDAEREGARSEERRVGKECRSRGSPYH